jgi:hypothetical protein
MEPGFRRAAPLIVLLLMAGSVCPLQAQQIASPSPQNVISANPFGLLLEFFNAEYERVVTMSSTAGVGGSTYSSGGDRYVNADAFWRFYPAARPLDGWAFGAKAGITSVTGHGTFIGYGFDANRSWLLGANDNFYVGIGLGLKRLLGASSEDFDLRFIPTIRIVNIGFAF